MALKIGEIFYAAATIGLLFCLLIFGAPIIKPLVFALFLSIMVLPILKFYNRFIKIKLLSVIVTILTVLIPIAGIVTIFAYQAREIFSDFDSLSEILLAGAQKTIDWINANTPLKLRDLRENLNGTDALPESVVDFLSSGLSTTVNTLALAFLTVIFMVFFLLYKNALVDFVRIQFPENLNQNVENILRKIKKTLISYLAGLGTVMIIMAILNSIGLLIIGVKYAVFFGVLAAILTIVPYLGTTLGGTLPFLYVLATGGGLLKAAAVVIFYFTIQQVEGNFITPKVVGDSVKVNPFAAIVGITIGTFMWGVAGIILAIPVLGVIRIVCEEIDALKPVAYILGSEIGNNHSSIAEQYDHPKNRIISLFKEKL